MHWTLRTLMTSTTWSYGCITSLSQERVLLGEEDKMNWYYEQKGPFCMTLFKYNGQLTTTIHHSHTLPDGMTTHLYWGDVAIHDKSFNPDEYGYAEWIQWCEQYGTASS